MFNYIIIGSGFSGSTIAERIANELNQKVLIIEKRDHIGGNCHDYYNKEGLLVHKYGPHIFHTEKKHVWDYVSQFTDWIPYQHEVLGFIDGKNVPIPFNLNSLYSLFPLEHAKKLEKKLVENFGYDVKIPILKLKQTQDTELKFLADFIYNKVFLNYTKKQWGFKPEELDPLVTSRVPVSISRDNRYFQDPYQGIPKDGYTKLFEKMLSHPKINIMLNKDSKELLHFDNDLKKVFFNEKEYEGTIIFTGEIDEFFNYEFGKLPYRSLRFEFDTVDKEYFQEKGTINYPNNYKFTRITEFKHMTNQKVPNTTIVKEYPQEYDKNVKGKDIPYYPIPQMENDLVYEKYKNKAQELDNVIFLGRLAEYKYYNMDLVVDSALNLFMEQIK